MLIAIHSLYTCLLQHLVYSHAYRNTCASRLRLTSPFTALHKLRLCTSSVCIVFFKNYRKMFINQHTLSHPSCHVLQPIFFSFSFLLFDYCRFCVVIRFFHPRHNGQWPPTSKDFYTRSYILHFYLSYNVFGMTRSLTGDWTRDLPHLKPALLEPALYH